MKKAEVVLAVLLVGCRGSSGVPAPSSEIPVPPVSISAPASLSLAPPSLSASRSADGCWGLALPTDPAARLAKLGERCAEGSAALFAEPQRLDATTLELALPTVADGTCVRVAAVSATTVGLVLVGPAGAAMAADRDAAFALAPLRGPLAVVRATGLRRTSPHGGA